MAWTLKLQIEVLEEFAEAQRAVDQTSGAISRWLWAREKRREIARKTEARPERKRSKAAHERKTREHRRGGPSREYLRDKEAQLAKRRKRNAEWIRKRRAAIKELSHAL